ncbi:MAG TPA: exodeoxyribonuclease I [Candidatus Saccharimonadales bacterium]|nr:exodeoxyribonuclease I [Candidatus Saccharimonadales bacterium]
MAASFFFYDLETTGINSRQGRIMQFAGQRTDMDLAPVGDPINVLIKLTPDVLPEPDAIMVTGITPQATLQDGITEAEFIKLFETEISTPGTIFVGYNTVRFDDEFMRCLLYRNFADPYAWQWKDGRSRWDLLDLARMTRALRPEGIEWPFAADGTPTVRLEYLTKVNGLDHENAHDALNDVYASIAVAKLIKEKQPKLFSYLLDMRDKKKVAGLVEGGKPFVYTSGKYSSETGKTTVATMLVKHRKKNCAIVYDLRRDPSEFIKLSPRELADRLQWVKDKDAAPPRLPAKSLQYNKCPAIAPLGVLDEAARKRLKIDMKTIEVNLQKLAAAPDFAGNVQEAFDLQEEQRQTEWLTNEQDVDCQLYDDLFSDADCRLLPDIRAAKPEALAGFADKLQDKRLKTLLPLYKARNYPAALSTEERAEWDAFCKQRLFAGEGDSRFAKFARRIQELAQTKLSQNQQFALEELHLYAESIMPADLEA